MKQKKLYTLFVLIATFCITSCTTNDNFSNKAFISGTNRVENIFIKPTNNNSKNILAVGMAKKEDADITFTFKVDASKVSLYNKTYNEEAIILPSENYNFQNEEVTIVAGSTRSSEAIIDFTGIASLDEDLVYVLPVVLESSHLALLESAQTNYFVFKGGALINIVANIEKNYLQPEFKDASILNNLKEFTLEALIKAHDFENGEISTIMGIEGKFLIRIGDANFERNQIQVATSSGNMPGRDSSKGLPTNKWVHVAVTFGFGTIIVYVDGKVQSIGSTGLSRVDFGVPGTDGFYVGYSYNADRYLNGEISECRIWNKVRSGEEILKGIYGVDPDSEGLVAYWKFDDGKGDIVKDYTKNGNHLKAFKELDWKTVSLPESK